MKNVVLLQNYFLLGDLEHEVERFVAFYNLSNRPWPPNAHTLTGV